MSFFAKKLDVSLTHVRDTVDAVFVEQVYEFEKNWKITKMEDILKIPLGKRVVIPPFSVVGGLFPFKFTGSVLMGFLTSCR